MVGYSLLMVGRNYTVLGIGDTVQHRCSGNSVQHQPLWKCRAPGGNGGRIARNVASRECQAALDLGWGLSRDRICSDSWSSVNVVRSPIGFASKGEWRRAVRRWHLHINRCRQSCAGSAKPCSPSILPWLQRTQHLWHKEALRLLHACHALRTQSVPCSQSTRPLFPQPPRRRLGPCHAPLRPNSPHNIGT